MINNATFTGIGPLAMLLVALLGSFVLLLYPLGRRYPDDQGDGKALVLLPPPKLTSPWRTVSMILVFGILDVLYHSVRGTFAPDALYGNLVQRVAETVVRAPAEMQGYFTHLVLGLRFLVVCTILSLAVTSRSTFLRRLLIAGQAFWYLLVLLFVDALLTVVTVLTGLPVAPGTVLGNFMAIAVGFFAMSRLLFVNFALPRPSSVPFVPRPRLNDAVVLIGCTVAGITVAATGFLLLYQAANPAYRSVFALLAPIPFGYLTTIIRSFFLWLVAKLTEPGEPDVGDERPPIDVILPAYNEEAVIATTLQAIDLAAGRYGGAVNVIIANDGSTDRTEVVAEEVIRGFRHATGRVVAVHHGGKSATLNSALAEATADIVIRIDADTLIGEWAFHYTPRWFRDPTIGIVEAMMWPIWHRSPFSRMRLLEELKVFGLVHRTMQFVDGVNVVPGVFTAFRREVAVQLGGFTVGMNGEDGDFTMRFSRVGYHSRQDSRIVVYEDVPTSFRDIREQRIRWDRASIHNHARHGPYRAGIATPKVWFSQYHQFFGRTFAPIRLTLPVYLVVMAVFEGTYRLPILLFAGAWVVSSTGFMVVESLLVVAYRFERRWGWLLLWPFWQACLVLFSAESWLSLPSRPASLFTGAKPVWVAKAVVH